MKRTCIALNTNTDENNITYGLANGSEPVIGEFHSSTRSVQRVSTGVTVSISTGSMRRLSNSSAYHLIFKKNKNYLQ